MKKNLLISFIILTLLVIAGCNKNVLIETTAAPETSTQAQTTTTPETSTQIETTTTPETSTQAQTTTTPETSTQAQTTTTPETSTQAQTTTTPETSTQIETTTTPETSTQIETTTTPETSIQAETTTAPETSTQTVITRISLVEMETTASIIEKTLVVEQKEIPTSIDTESEYSTSFKKKSNFDKSNRVPVYFGKTRIFESEGTIWVSSDNSIASVDSNGKVTAWNEGIVDIMACDEKGIIVDTFKIYCTTYNDGRDPLTYSPRTKNNKTDVDNDIFRNGTNPEILKNEINTIRDLMTYLTYNNFYYNSNMPICATRSCWTWAVDGPAVLELQYGVCCDIANVAAYVLQYDYEELGYIYHCGHGIGHVYNYVYEDGYYYIFDLTEVISNNTLDPFFYNIYKVRTLEEFMKIEVNNGKINTEDEYMKKNLVSVIAVDSLNHEEQPAMYMNYMKKSSMIYELEEIVVGFEEGVPYTVLYNNPSYNTKIISVPLEEMPLDAYSWFRDYSTYRGYELGY